MLKRISNSETSQRRTECRIFDLDPVRIIGIMLGFIIGTTIHEFMHAYTAVMLGDNSPRRAGRVTLNPAAHSNTYLYQ